ncbi:head-to-tail connector complex protein [Burkholderia phage Maja]|uniref:Head-to-tail connector complex protein n=1 Tax=Burkholderia phage Maja TaxID=2767571 RepID=A0A7S6R751_9CAUD|nr:head-to-tail connector complex protein [Burkholderia phage Maja]
MAAPAYNDDLFRKMFPEFADPAKYPANVIEVFYETAQLFITGSTSPCAALSGKQLVGALNMLTAHLMSLSKQRTQTALGATNDQGGYTLSATIGEVSVSKMAPPARDGWEFWLAQTPYGQELWALLKMLSVGGFAIGGLPERDGFRKVGGVFW